jgi:hypothetical protein
MTLSLLAALVVAMPASGAKSERVGDQATSGLWDRVEAKQSIARRGGKAYIRPERFRTFALDLEGMKVALDAAPRESLRSAGARPIVLSLPAPRGGFQRFAVEESSVMEPALARRHPEITTYAGDGIDDPTATIRADLTPLGFHASVRSQIGVWYVDPRYHLDTTRYISYYARDLRRDPHGTFVERGPRGVDAADEALGLDLAAADVPEGPIVTLRTYRLALVSDPTYSNFFGGPANVTAGR